MEEGPVLKKRKEDQVFFDGVAVVEALLRHVVPIMNPFMAMKVFAKVPRIARALSTDTTLDGRILWTSYMERYFTIGKVQPEKNWRAKFNDIAARVSAKDSFELLSMFLWLQSDNYMSPRRMFIWLWMAGRCISRNIIHTVNQAKQIELLHIKQDQLSRVILRKLLCAVCLVLPANDETEGPMVMKEIHMPTNVTLRTLGETSSIFSYHKCIRSIKSTVEQHIIYSICQPILDIIFYRMACFNFCVVRSVEDIVTMRTRPNQLLMVSQMLKRWLHLPLPCMLNFGDDDLHTTYIQRQICTVNTTYPRNPDGVTPGMYLG